MTTQAETLATIRVLPPNDVWETYVGDQSTSAFADESTDDAEIDGLTRAYTDDCELTADLDQPVRREIAEKLAEHIRSNREYTEKRK